MEHAFRVLGARAGAALLSCNCLIHLRSHQPRSALPRSPSPGGPIEIVHCIYDWSTGLTLLN